MNRITKDYDERYAEFLDVAQSLFYSKGYEPTSVQKIIKTIGVAKGTFYYYFSSKIELLEAVVERSYEETLKTLEPIVTNQALNSVDKLEQFFTHINNWKVAHRDLMIDTARVLYADENVLLREKMRKRALDTVAPLLAKIIEQGIEQDTFDVEYPLATAELIVRLSESLSERAISALLSEQYEEAEIEHVKQQIIVYNRSIERVLGLPKGLLVLIEPSILDVWYEQHNQ